MDLVGGTVSGGTALLLVLAVGLALSFEFVNGFHDTANAVATVIYTHSLKSHYAVIWSGFWNLAGVMASTGAVAFSVTSLLPVELVLNVGSAAGFAMVFALLISAMIWNLGTWYLGLPASSSHTLIGSILGVGLAHSLLTPGGTWGEGVNWSKAGEVGMSMLISPAVGFCCGALLLLLSKRLIQSPELYRAPDPGKAPPLWIRSILITTCTGVSFAHGSNDGQKGMGLILLILIGILPGSYALDRHTASAEIAGIVQSSEHANAIIAKRASSAPSAGISGQAALSEYLRTRGEAGPQAFAGFISVSNQVHAILTGIANLNVLSGEERSALRSDIYLVSETIAKFVKTGQVADPAEKATLLEYKSRIDRTTRFIPNWVKFSVAVALGLGTMIGWRRIVVTVGEKIGKEHLTYAQGAAAELVAMTTIGAADLFGLPVSTTHVLSSGVAGTMAANHSGLETGTLRNLALAWVLTLPVCIFLGAVLFALVLNIILAIGLK